MPSYQHRNFHYKDEMVSSPSYLYNKNPYSWKFGLYIETVSCMHWWPLNIRSICTTSWHRTVNHTATQYCWISHFHSHVCASWCGSISISSIFNTTKMTYWVISWLMTNACFMGMILLVHSNGVNEEINIKPANRIVLYVVLIKW